MQNGISNVRNKYICNTAVTWNQVYERDYAAKLDSPDQQARNHLISGIIADVAELHPSILDVGCGVGTVYRLIQHHDVDYKGIDISQIAIAHCDRDFGTQKGRNFEVAEFENFESKSAFEVIVFNEVLYYFRLSQVRPVIKKAVSLLRGRNSLLVISMSNNPKAQVIWFLCRFLRKPLQSISVRSKQGNSWTVKSYAPLA